MASVGGGGTRLGIVSGDEENHFNVMLWPEVMEVGVQIVSSQVGGYRFWQRYH